MKIPQQHLTITQNTTAAQLHDFISKGGDAQHQKLVGKQVNGHTVLFFKENNSSSLAARISGKAAERRNLAKTALDTVLTRVEGNLGNKLKTDGKEILVELHSNVTGNGSHALRKDGVTNFSAALLGLHQADKALSAPKPTPQQTLETALPPNLLGTTGANVQVDVHGQQVDLPKVQIGGNTYGPVQHLTDGGFAGVFLYRNENNHNDVKVVKIPLAAIDADAQQIQRAQPELQKFEQEVILHANIGGGANRNSGIVAMEGAFRLANGAPCLIMEHAPNGDLQDFGKGLRALEGNGQGQIPTKLADLISLSLLKDVATGLEGMHNANIVHNDAKGANILIGTDGHAKWSDLGEAQDADELEAHTLENVNPLFSSPQLIQANRELGKAGAEKAAANTGVRAIIDNLPLGKAEKSKLKKEMTAAIDRGYGMDTDQISNFDPFANDNWGMGTAAVALFSGKFIRPDDNANFNDAIANRVLGFTNAVQPRNAQNQIPDDALVAATGKPVDALINQQLHGDATQRLDPNGVLSHGAMQQVGVGSDAVHEFVPIAAKMMSLQNNLTKLTSELQDVQRGGHYHLEQNPQAKAAKIQQLNQDIAALNVQINTFTPTFETAKQTALQEISTQEAIKDIDDLIASLQ